MAADGETAPSPATFELEHAVGYSGAVRDSLVMHPNGQDLLYAAGGCVVACDKDDPHKQTFFRGHDDNVSSLSVSVSGRYVASGQAGSDSDVIVWDYEKRDVLFRCQEHSGGVAGVAFTADEKLFATLGAEDNSLVVWDVSSGAIVASTNIGPAPAVVVAWGGAAKDVKRRATSDYVLCTAGNGVATLWTVNPYTGSLTGKKFNTGSRPCLRNYTCAQFSEDGDWLFCGSSSGDFTVFNVRSVGLKGIQNSCGGGVLSINVVSSDVVLVGGGDGSLAEFCARDEVGAPPPSNRSLRPLTIPCAVRPLVSLCRGCAGQNLLGGDVAGQFSGGRVVDLGQP